MALAGATSLAHIGRDPQQKGSTARALAGALDQVRPDRRLHLLRALRWLAGTDYGENADPWLRVGSQDALMPHDAGPGTRGRPVPVVR